MISGTTKSFYTAKTLFFAWLLMLGHVSGLGANWGTQASHPLPPSKVVELLQDDGFQKVKLFDAEDGTMSALKNSRIEVMVGIPNDMLLTLATNLKAAENWVSQNVSSYINDGVNISKQAKSTSLKPFMFFQAATEAPCMLLVIACNSLESRASTSPWAAMRLALL